MELLEELRIPQLTTEQIEELCAVAEKNARKHVLSKISSKKLEIMDVIVEAEDTKPLSLNVKVEIVLSAQRGKYGSKELADEAIRTAFEAIEDYLRKLV